MLSVCLSQHRSRGFELSSLYWCAHIDDRHNGQLQVRFDAGAYAHFATDDARHFAAAQSAIFLVCYHLIRLGYFLGLKKPILVP